MTKATRRAKVEQDLRLLELAFEEQLIEALRACAAGHWGLFGQNDEALQRAFTPKVAARLIPTDAQELLAMGSKIEQLRGELGYATGFPLYERFEAARSMRGSNTFGEPKLAQQLLDELETPAGGRHRENP
jgi:hypothetical protein